MDFRAIANRIAAKAEESNKPTLIPNPFPGSKIPYPVYHGSLGRGITKFRRPPQGVWFAGTEGWAEEHYIGRDNQGEVTTCYVNVKNPYTPTDDELDKYYGATYGTPEELKGIQDFFDGLKSQGYDAYLQDGESDSIAVLDTVEIVNAVTGEKM